MPQLPPAVVSSAADPWLLLVGVVVVLLAVDLVLMRHRSMDARTAAVASVAWIAVSLAFFAGLLLLGEAGDAEAYLAGYLVEKSLSLDNVFVFLLVFTAFAVPVDDRHRLLTYGIVLALVLRTVFIVSGAVVLDTFGWVAFLFAALLIWTGWRMLQHRHDHDADAELVTRLSRRLPISTAPPEGRLSRREEGRRVLTASGAALVGIALVDIIFAVDSVPAILAITSDTYLVVAANAFALLGLRPLFFLVADLVDRLYYLKTALAALLIFIGLKLVAGELFGKVGPGISLSVIAAILLAGVLASLVRSRRLARLTIISEPTPREV